MDLNFNKIYDQDNFSIGLEGAYWYQPKLGSLNPLAEKCKAGGYGAINSEIKLLDDISGLVSLGYKSNGFKENLPLKNSFIARIGLKLNI